MSEGVVDLLEPIHVDHRAGESVAMPAMPDPLSVRMVQEGAPVQHAGQRVDHRQLTEPAGERGELRDGFVIAAAEHVDLVHQLGGCRRLAAHSREVRPLDAVEPVCGADQPLAAAVHQLEGEREGAVLVHGERLPQALLRGVVEGADEALARSDQGNRGAEAGARFDDAELGVEDHEKVR